MQKKILLVYIGNEQGAWGSIAYARASHFYIMPGIQYCAEVLKRDERIAASCEIKVSYYNRTVETLEEIEHDITGIQADCVGFSSYCWNMSDNLKLVEELKRKNSTLKTVFGGPEVTLRNESEYHRFFNEYSGIDCLVFGEAEKKLPAIIHKMLFDGPVDISQTGGYAFHPSYDIPPDFTIDFVVCPDDIPSIYPFEAPIKRSRECGLAMVYETGRGCPYRCIYCQFGHRNHKPFRFPIERVARETSWLLENRFDCIHFADAVFDLDREYAKNVVSHLIGNNITTSTFFYCSFNQLDEELAALFARLQCQIGVGIQSTNPVVLRELHRALSPHLFNTIRSLLEKYRLNFYVDLIYGLPRDTPESYEASFCQALTLHPSFLMTFPLTLIKGTSLGEAPERYGMICFGQEELAGIDLKCDIEYRNVGLYKNFTLESLEQFDDAALALFYFYNRFRFSLSHLEKRITTNVYRLYQSIGKEIKKYLTRIGMRASNTTFIDGFEDEIRKVFTGVLEHESAGSNEISAFHELFKLDIFRLLILSSPLREKRFQAKQLICTTKSGEQRVIRSSHGKEVKLQYRFEDLLQLHKLQNEIVENRDTVLIVAPFEHWNTHLQSLSPLEEYVLSLIPADRGIRLKSLMHSVSSWYTRSGHEPPLSEEMMGTVLNELESRRIIFMY